MINDTGLQHNLGKPIVRGSNLCTSVLLLNSPRPLPRIHSHGFSPNTLPFRCLLLVSSPQAITLLSIPRNLGRRTLQSQQLPSCRLYLQRRCTPTLVNLLPLGWRTTCRAGDPNTAHPSALSSSPFLFLSRSISPSHPSTSSNSHHFAIYSIRPRTNIDNCLPFDITYRLSYLDYPKSTVNLSTISKLNSLPSNHLVRASSTQTSQVATDCTVARETHALTGCTIRFAYTPAFARVPKTSSIVHSTPLFALVLILHSNHLPNCGWALSSHLLLCNSLTSCSIVCSADCSCPLCLSLSIHKRMIETF